MADQKIIINSYENGLSKKFDKAAKSAIWLWMACSAPSQNWTLWQRNLLTANYTKLGQNLIKVCRRFAWKVHLLPCMGMLKPAKQHAKPTALSSFMNHVNKMRPQGLERKLIRPLSSHPRVKAWRHGLSSLETICTILLCKPEGVLGRRSDRTMLFVAP